MKQVISAVAFSLLLASSAMAQNKPAGEPDNAAAAMKVETPKFVEMVASSNMFEIESSKLAEQKSQSEDIKAFAEQMIADHTKAGEDLKATGQTPPMKYAPKHAGMIKLLEAADGADFDALYLDMQAQAHMEAVMLFRTYSASGDDEKVVAFAKKTLPTLEMHMAHVKELVAKK
jgi:putative membrane protein